VSASDELPVVPGEVIGWRVWLVTTGRRPRLLSPMYQVEWPTDDWLRAGTGRGCGALGIHAAASRDDLLAMGYPSYEYLRGLVAIGEVGLAGVIEPGERGYRAERGRVVSVVLPYAAWDVVRPLRHAYRVPVTLGNVLADELVRIPRGHRA
jgi:hypothetical protein